MKHMKRHAVSACLAALLLLSLAGCGANGSDSDSGNTSGTDYSNSTVTAQVQSIDGGSVTAIVGELSERQGGGQGGPNGQNTSGGAAGGPNLEGGQGDGTAPGGGDAPEPPDGDGQQPPELPDGGSGSDGVSGGAVGGQAPEGAPEGGGPGRSVFTADGESISFAIPDSAVITLESRDGSSEGSLSDIQVGSILEITFGDENTVAAVTVKSVPTGGPGGQAPDGAPDGTNGSDSGSPDSNGSGTGSNSGDSGAASGANASGDSGETGE